MILRMLVGVPVSVSSTATLVHTADVRAAVFISPLTAAILALDVGLGWRNSFVFTCSSSTSSQVMSVFCNTTSGVCVCVLHVREHSSRELLSKGSTRRLLGIFVPHPATYAGMNYEPVLNVAYPATLSEE